MRSFNLNLNLLLLLAFPAYLLATEGTPSKPYRTTWACLADSFFKDRDNNTRASASILPIIQKRVPGAKDLSIENVLEKYRTLSTRSYPFSKSKQQGIEKVVTRIILNPRFDPIDLMILLDDTNYGAKISDQLYNLALIKLCLFFNVHVDLLSYSQVLLLNQFCVTHVENTYKEPFDFIIACMDSRDETFLKHKKSYNLVLNYSQAYFRDLNPLIASLLGYHLTETIKHSNSPEQLVSSRLTRAKLRLMDNDYEENLNSIMGDLMFCVDGDKGKVCDKVDAIFQWVQHGMRYKDNHFTFFVKAAAQFLPQAEIKNTEFYDNIDLLLKNIFKTYSLKTFKYLPNESIATLVGELLKSPNTTQKRHAQLYNLFLYKRGLQEFEEAPDMSFLQEFDLPANLPLHAFFWSMKAIESNSPTVILGCLRQVIHSKGATLNDLVTVLELKHHELSTVSAQLKKLNLNSVINKMLHHKKRPINQFWASVCRAYLKFIQGNLDAGIKILSDERDQVMHIKNKPSRRALKASTRKQLEFKIRYLDNELAKGEIRKVHNEILMFLLVE